MRWESLFDDLEAQLAAADDDSAMHAERVRAEVAGVVLLDRVRAAVGAPVRLRLLGGRRLDGTVTAAGPGWLLLAEPPGEALVPLAAVAVLDGLPRTLAAPAGAVERRLGLASVLRGVARDRSAVRLLLREPGAAGDGHEGGSLTGTVDRVGADHLDLAVHPVDEARRPAAVQATVAVPLEALACLRRAR